MTKDEFKAEFKRLCEGFNYKPSSPQMEAFFERLQHCHQADWHEAVTDLLCAPYFPKNIEVMWHAIETRADQRRKRRVEKEKVEAKRTTDVLRTGMREALADRPDLQHMIERFIGKS